jgi:hypothetical protein
MLPENGGGIAVAVSASENHTAVLTDTGALFTWGATYGKNILGHEGVRWQPDPKRVPGVYRAVGVAAAKEHTILLVGATFPPVPPPVVNSSLENLAARKVAEHVDLFNVLPILIMAERTQCALLLDYCTDFVRRNLDGVLNVGQRSHMDCYLNEQLVSRFIGCDEARDGRHHPFLLDVITAGNAARPSFENRDALSTTSEWISACGKLSQSVQVAAMVSRYLSAPSAASTSAEDALLARRRLARSRSLSTHSISERYDNESCSERCLDLTTHMDLSSKELAEAKHACILKDMRWVRKRLGQIAKLQQGCGSGDVPLMTPEQLEKLSRQPQLNADLLLFEPALAAVEKRLKEFGMVDASKEKANALRCSDDVKEKNEPEATGASKLESKKASFRCETCQITCPDENSHALHINGRKHRNRVAMVLEKEQQHAAASMMEERQRQQMAAMMAGSAVSPPPKQCKAPSPWKTDKSSSLPKYTLPPPPHPVPDAVASPASSKLSGTKSLREIMAEESQKPKSSAKMSPSKSAKMSPSKSTRMTLQLPQGSAPTLQSPPWASPVARVSAAAAAPSTPWASQPEIPKAAYSLGDFLKPEPRPTNAGVNRPVGWTSPKPATPQGSLSASAVSFREKIQQQEQVSFREIQQQEHVFKTELQDRTYGDNSKWFIERRERAGSFREIESETAKELKERLFIEEQLRIETEIHRELAARKANEGSKTRSSKRSNNNKPKNNRKPNPPGAKAKSPNEGKCQSDPPTKGGGRRKNSSSGKKGTGSAALQPIEIK